MGAGDAGRRVEWIGNTEAEVAVGGAFLADGVEHVGRDR